MFKDKSGRECKPGDLIVYAVTCSSSAEMKYGKVLEVVKGGLRVRGFNGVRLQQIATIPYRDRVLILERHQTPEHLLALFDAVDVEAIGEPAGLAKEESISE